MGDPTSIQCLVLPQPVLRLALVSNNHDRFSNIVLLSRFFVGQTKDAEPLWEHYPTAEWLRQQHGVLQRPRSFSMEDAQLRPAMFEAVANALREYYAVLGRDQDDPEVLGLMRSLRTKVQWLTNAALQLQGGRDAAAPLEGQSQHVRHSARRLLCAFQASVNLRDKQRDFGQVLRSSVQAAWPHLFDEAMLAGPVVSPSFIQRSQLIVDIALVPCSAPGEPNTKQRKERKDEKSFLLVLMLLGGRGKIVREALFVASRASFRVSAFLRCSMHAFKPKIQVILCDLCGLMVLILAATSSK